MEHWKNIKGYEGLYQVSDLGRIRNKRNRILKPTITKKGYCRIGLSNNSKVKFYFVHNLVIETFRGKQNLSVDHIDCNKQNNKIDNLEYVTQQENCIRAWKNGLCKIVPYNEKPVIQYDLDGNLINVFKSVSEASRKTNIAKQHISLCCNNLRAKTHGFIFKFDRNVNKL